MTLQDLIIDHNWTLFLDRDGVINTRIIDDYVKSWDQFSFLPGVLPALKIFSGIFGKIIVVSNQQGIAKEVMTVQDVEQIHQRMIQESNSSGAVIHAVYYAPQLASSGSVMRKPNVGMALQARKQFPEIRFKRSVMVGDSLSDMLFGKRLDMKTVFLSHDSSLPNKNPRLIDFFYPDLKSFADAL
ncbi:MAG: HAD-IIIA family hydrolase [Bacteroidales bacterium]|nr:HAD-IIIA family hydrolase [Bacteroidales bacterium]MDD4604078.1 HAD-IIIA family hydrolase [Bacteroidales bacterium]